MLVFSLRRYYESKQVNMLYQSYIVFDTNEIVENNFVGMYLSRWSLLTSENKRKNDFGKRKKTTLDSWS